MAKQEYISDWVLRAQKIAHLGIWDQDPVSGELWWSDETFRILGLKPQSIAPSFDAFLQLVHPDDRERIVQQTELSLRSDDHPYKVEYRILWPDRSERIVHEEALIERDEKGKSTKITGIIQDITKQKKAEQALRASETRYNLLFENMLNGFAYHRIITDENGRPVDYVFLEINKAFEKLTGFDRKDIIGERITRVHPGIKDMGFDWIGTYGKVALSGEPIEFEQYFAPQQHWYHISAYCPQKMHFAVSFENITERKQSEAALKESNAQLNLALNAANAGTWEWDLRTNKNIWSDRLWSLYGLASDCGEPSYDLWLQSIHPDDRNLIAAKVQTNSSLGDELNFEWRVNLPAGTERWLMARGKPERDEYGQVSRYRGIVLDITERIEAEEKLQHSENQLRLIADQSPAYIAYIGIDDLRYRFVNKHFVESFNLPMEEIVGKQIKELLSPANYELALKSIEEVRKGRSVSSENVFTIAQTKRWINVNSVPEYDKQGKVVGMVVLSYDITRLKRAEEESKAHIRFLEILHQIDQAIKQEADIEQMLGSIVNAVFSFFDCDRAWLLHPCDPDAPTFRIPVEISRPEYPGAKELNLQVPMAPEQAQELRDALASEDPVTHTAGTENPISKETAKQFGVQAQMFIAIYPKLGKPWLLGIHQCSYPRIWTDEERKIFKEISRRISDGLSSALSLCELQENEARFRIMFEQAAVGVAQIETQTGRFIRINRRYCDIIGYTTEKMKTKTCMDITHPEDLELYLDNMGRLTAGEIREFTIEKRYLKKDGSVVWVNLSASPMWQRGEKPDYHIAIISDITALKKAREQIAASLREKELLLREIHHRVKNNMQIISSLLQLQAVSCRSDAEKRSLLEAQSRITVMAAVHQKLYQSENLANISFNNYVKSFIHDLFSLFGVDTDRVQFILTPHDINLSIEHAIPCGLIINELIANSCKYAFPNGKKGIISVSLQQKKKEMFELCVSDNGVGLPEGLDLDTLTSLGLKLVHILAKQQLDGTLTLDRTNGTQFCFRFPNKK